MKEIKGWTSLRAFAAIWVVLLHYGLYIDFEAPKWMLSGSLAVDLFFVLSGFVMGHIYIQKIAGGSFSYKSFLWKRFARLYPVFLATTLGYIILLVLDPKNQGQLADRLNGFDLFVNAAMLQAFNLTERLTLNYPSWSISAEMFAYLLFPLMGIWIIGIKRPGWALISVIICLAALSVADYVISDGLRYSTDVHGVRVQDEGINIFFERTYDFSLLRVSSEFLLGLSFYRCLQMSEHSALRRFLEPMPALLIAALIVGSLYVGISLITVLLFAFLIASVFVRGVDCGRFVNYVGAISYSIYMGHALVQLQFHTLIYGQGFETARLIAGVAVAIGFGALLYHFIEQPFRHALVTGRGNGGILRTLIGQYRAMIPGLKPGSI